MQVRKAVLGRRPRVSLVFFIAGYKQNLCPLTCWKVLMLSYF